MPVFSHPGVPEKQKEDQSQEERVRKGKEVRKHVPGVGRRLIVEGLPGPREMLALTLCGEKPLKNTEQETGI